MNALEKKIKQHFLDIPSEVTPGFVLRVYKSGKLVCDLEHGKTWKYYDLASLTKIFFTVPLMIRAVSQNKIDVLWPLHKYLAWYPHPLMIKNLLNHSAGNEWWMPFYKMVNLQEHVEDRKNTIKEKIRISRIKQNPQAVYSDVDFLLLGFLLEQVYGSRWIELWQELAQDVFKTETLFFNENNQTDKKINLFAPTENCPWRGHVLQGEVHDENAWSIGGVAPHAGLFGSVDAVSQWGLWFRRHFYGEKRTWAEPEMFQRFCQRSMPAQKGDWALGFMMPTLGSASCGKYFSKYSVGHTGFTGTSFWFDPEKDIFIVLLSNRVNPTRHNESFRKLRPQVHDWVIEQMREEMGESL